MSETFRVLDLDGRFFTVERGSWACDCGKDQCAHGQFVRSLVVGDKPTEFMTVSALHKEVRRGDAARALIWAKWVQHFRGVYRTKQYLKNILFEETRNLNLYVRWCETFPALGVEDMVLDICGSQKKWEIKAARGMYPIMLRAVVDAKSMPTVTLNDVDTAPAIGKLEFYNWVVAIARIAWLAAKDRFSPVVAEGRRVLATAMSRALWAEGYDNEADLLRKWPDYQTHCLGAEALCGFRESTADTIVRSTETIDADVLMPSDYIYDVHTDLGRQRVRNLGWPRIGVASLPGLDHRWCGKEPGVWWRYRAVDLYGDDYKVRPWEAVQADRAEIDRVVAVRYY